MRITYDIEDWYNICSVPALYDPTSWVDFEPQILENTALILDFMEKQNLKGTFYIVGYQAEKHKNLVRKISQNGHEIGSHGYAHLNVRNLNVKEFECEIYRSKAILEDITGDLVSKYRAPEFSLEPSRQELYEALSKFGYNESSSVKVHWRKYLKTTVSTDFGEITEVPVGCLKIFNKLVPYSGGTYLKLIPPFVIKKLKLRPEMIYAHPHDFGRNIPFLKHQSFLKNFFRRSSLGTAYENRLSAIFQNYDKI